MGLFGNSLFLRLYKVLHSYYISHFQIIFNLLLKGKVWKNWKFENLRFLVGQNFLKFKKFEKKLKFENADFQAFMLKGKFEKIENLRFLVGQNFLKLENLKNLKKIEIWKCGFSNFQNFQIFA